MKFQMVLMIVMMELLIVSWIDFRIKKISNYWLLLNLLLALGLYVAQADLYQLSWNILVFPVGFIAIGFILFLLNIMGAGDSKYLASLFLLTPSEYQMVLFEKIILSTILTGSILLLVRFFKHRRDLMAFIVNRHWKGIRDIMNSRFSYAPVISVAWVLLGIELWK